MPTDFDQLLKDVFGESLNRLNQFQSEKIQKLQQKLQELAREAVKEEFTKFREEIHELRNRVAVLEAERAHQAADSIQSSF